MFNEYDWVIHTKTGNRGQVLEIADDIAYLELENGVEMDFPVSDLMLEADYQTPEETAGDRLGEALDGKMPAAVLVTCELMLADMRPALVRMGELYSEQAAHAITVLGGSATPWTEMNAYHKMNFVSVVTSIPLEKWVEAYGNNTLTRLQLVAFAMIGQNFMDKK